VRRGAARLFVRGGGRGALAMSQHGAEAERLLKLAGDPRFAYEMVERQLAGLGVRTQVLLSLSGIVITVTGFCGRAVAQVSLLARVCITVGMLVVLASAVVAILGVFRLQWLTQIIDEDPLATIIRGLEICDRKARFLSLALLLWVGGFALYCVAV